MKISIAGIGIWGPGFCSWPEFIARNKSATDALWTAPKPAAIPARERRRAPLMVRLAVEVAHQACAEAGVAISDVATVFASAMGDSEITDYMCRTLAGDTRILSPTRFHNSVHNAPAGYWSISSENRSPSSSVAASRESFPAALLETGTLVATQARPVLLIASDIGIEPPLGDVYPIREPFGAALLIDGARPDSQTWSLEVEAVKSPAPWPAAASADTQSIADHNPAGRCLPLLEAHASDEPRALAFPLNEHLRLTMVPAVEA